MNTAHCADCAFNLEDGCYFDLKIRDDSHNCPKYEPAPPELDYGEEHW